MSAILDLAAQVEALAGEVARVDRAALSDTELIALTKANEQIGRFVDTSRVLDAGEVADRSRYELGAAGLSMRMSERKPNNFVEQITRVSQAEATRRIRIGLAIRDRQSMLGEILPPERPIVAEAMTNGLIGIDTASTILWSLKQAAKGSDATPERMDEAELALVQMGTKDSADLVADAGRLWRDALDPDGIEPRYEEIRERQVLTISRERNGIKKYIIAAGPVLAAEIDAALLESMDPKALPRFLSEEDLANASTELVESDGETIERVVDPRSLERKQYDVIEGVILAGVRATRDGAPNMRTIGSVTATITLEALESGEGFGALEGVDEVIPASAIQELACDTGFYKVLLGSKGEPIYHGLLLRYFSQAQRRLMVARDGDRCIAKGCKTRAAACHAHHVIFFSHDGPTDIDNGVLLCPAHHHALHQGAFELKMVDGMPWIRAGIDAFDDDAWKPASRSRLMLTTSV